MSPSRVPEGETRGHIVSIGGAENKENDPKILARFVQVSGGANADIVVIPTASRAHETGERYEKLFRELDQAAATLEERGLDYRVAAVANNADIGPAPLVAPQYGCGVTAEDCVASIKRWGARDAVGRLMMASLAKFQPADRKTFVLELGTVAAMLSKQ